MLIHNKKLFKSLTKKGTFSLCNQCLSRMCITRLYVYLLPAFIMSFEGDDAAERLVYSSFTGEKKVVCVILTGQIYFT